MDNDTAPHNSASAEGILMVIEAELRKTVPQFFEIWNEIGYNGETIAKLGAEIVHHTRDLWGDMLVEVQSKRERLLKDIEVTLDKITNLSTELKQESNLNYQNEPLIEVQTKLHIQLKELQEIKEKRLEKYKHLLKKEHEICQMLGVEPIGLDSSFPTEKQLESFKDYLSKQEDEAIQLKQEFKQIRHEILAMNNQLSYDPVDEFEKIVCNDYKSFVYSSTNMTKLRQFHGRLKEEIDSLKELADNKRRELVNLWTWLDVAEETYREFLERYSGFDTATLTALNKEIKHCKEVRKENMAKYIQKVRQEIVQWWDTCRIGQAERDAFRPFCYETFNEDTLAIHEMEVKRLQAHYQQNEKIYEVLNQESDMWNKYKQLMLREDDPNRFNNRGGQLLEEEKQRKFVKKALPKIGAQLLQLLTEYEEQNGKPFLIDGLSYEEFQARELEQFSEEKENARVARARAKEEQKSAKKTPLSVSRRNLTTVKNDGLTPLSISRKRMANSEKTRVLGSKIRRSGQLNVVRKLLSSSLNGSKRSSLSAKKTPRKRTQTTATTTSDTSNTLTPYEEFQNGLVNRDELRSTLVSNEVLAVPLSLMSSKTPVRTPAKPLRKRPGHLAGGSSTPRGVVTPRSNKSPKITHTPRLTTAPRRNEQF